MSVFGFGDLIMMEIWWKYSNSRYEFQLTLVSLPAVGYLLRDGELC